MSINEAIRIYEDVKEILPFPEMFPEHENMGLKALRIIQQMNIDYGLNYLNDINWNSEHAKEAALSIVYEEVKNDVRQS